MPTAAPTIADSLIGVSKHRRSPKRSCKPFVHRKTPPNAPTSSPKTTTESSASMATTCASWMASIIDRGATSVPRRLALRPEVRRHALVHVVEHRGRRRPITAVQRAVRLGLLLRREDLSLDLRVQTPEAL